MSEIIIPGAEGRLEGRIHVQKDPAAPLALVIHPDPRKGGTMNNKVVLAMYRAFSEQGFTTLRFNSRGVGRSQGQIGDGEGELSDAATVLDWLQLHNPHAHTCWIAGFSFGAWIAMQLLMRRPEISGFVCISLPAQQMDFSFLAPCPVSGLVLQGGEDPVVSPKSVRDLIQKLGGQRGIVIDYQEIPGADHLFSQKIDEVTQHLTTYLSSVRQLNPSPKVAYAS